MQSSGLSRDEAATFHRELHEVAGSPSTPLSQHERLVLDIVRRSQDCRDNKSLVDTCKWVGERLDEVFGEGYLVGVIASDTGRST